MADIDANCKYFDKKYMKKGQRSIAAPSPLLLIFHFAYILLSHVDSN